jgi:hypothetical protein
MLHPGPARRVVPVPMQNIRNGETDSEQRQRRPPEGGRYKFKSDGRFKSDDNGDGWRSEDRRYKFNGNGKFKCNCSLLDFSSHAAYYVVYCDVADRALRAIYYCQAAEVVFVEKLEDIFVVGVGRY